MLYKLFAFKFIQFNILNLLNVIRKFFFLTSLLEFPKGSYIETVLITLNPLHFFTQHFLGQTLFFLGAHLDVSSYELKH